MFSTKCLFTVDSEQVIFIVTFILGILCELVFYRSSFWKLVLCLLSTK